MTNLVYNADIEVDAVAKQNIADQVRQAIAQVPPVNSMVLEVDEQGIYTYQIGNQRWWKVPIIACPFPQRLFPLYELMAEIEELLQSNNLNVILFAGDFGEETSVASA